MATVFCCNGVHAAILAAAKQVQKEKEYVIFADDKATVSLEAAILACAEGHASFNATVTSFTRFLARSGKAVTALSKEGSSMAIRRILASGGDYAVLPSSAGKKNLSATLYEMIAQLKSACVTPQDLLAAAEGESGLLALKLKDLSSLYARYEAYLSENGFTDQGGYLSLLPPYLERYRPLAGKEVFLVGYTSFTRQMQNVIAALFASGANVSGFFACGSAVGTDAARSVFVKTAEACGKTVEEIPFFSETCDAADHLRRTLGSVENYKSANKRNTDDVGILCTASPEEEAEFVARKAACLVRSGARYRDIGVIAPDLATYRPVLSAAFSKYSVPFFADEKRTLASHPLYRFIADYLALQAHGLTPERVFALVGSPYFSQKEGVSSFRNYVERFGVIGARFFAEFTLNAPEKEGAEAVRCAFSALYEAIPRQATAKEYIAALSRFLQKSQALATNKTLAAAFEDVRPDVASFTKQSPAHLGRLLGETERVLGDVVLSVKEFAEILESGAQADEMNLIPTSIDAVTVAPPEKMLSSVKKRLFAVGMTDGVPAVTGDTAFLSDKDLLTLERRGVNIDPRISEINARAMEETVEALTSFTERLILSYPSATAKGERNRPSELIALIGKAVNCGDGSEKKILSLADCENQPEFLVGADRYAFAAQAYATPAAAEESFLAGYYGYMEGEKNDFSMENGYYGYLRERDRKEGTFAANALTDRLNGAEEEKKVNGTVVPTVVSPTSLESYFHCPYAHFLDHVLHLSEKKTAEVNPMESGTFIHAVVEKFALKMMEGGVKKEDVATLSAEICEEVAASEEYVAKRSSKRNEHMIEMLKKEALRACGVIYDQIARSKYRILAAEQKFGYQEALKPPRLFSGKRNVFLRGTIDRVDESENYVRVIDYKTGSISTKEADLYAGTKAQLYLYMNTVAENYDKPLSGAYYFPVSREFGADPEEPRLLGKTLEDLSAIAEQDLVFSKPFDHQESSVIAFRLGYKKDGTLKAESGRGNLLSQTGMQSYAKYAKLVTERALSEMEEGFIRPTPFGDQCQYCAYGGICGREEFIHGAPREVGEVNADTIIAAVAHEEALGKDHSARGKRENAPSEAAEQATTPREENC